MGRKKKDTTNEVMTLEVILHDDKLLETLCMFIIEMNRRTKNLETSKRELKECQDKFKDELGITKANFDEIVNYAMASLENSAKDVQEKDRINLYSKLAEVIVEKAENNKQLKNSFM